MEHIHHVRLVLRKQKNMKNCQKINLAQDDNNLDYCAVWTSLCIYLHVIHMGEQPTKPPGIFQNIRGQKKYITTAMVASYSHLRHCTLVVFETTKEDPASNCGPPTLSESPQPTSSTKLTSLEETRKSEKGGKLGLMKFTPL